jgi:putative redox protein
VSLTHDLQDNTNIHREIEFIGDLSQDEKDRLLAIANKCPVHKTLTHPILIDTKLKD